MNVSTENNMMVIHPFLSPRQNIILTFCVLSLSIPVCAFGIMSNIINIIVFLKMGFATPSNISLFCLAITDLLTLCPAFVGFIGNHPAIVNNNLSFSVVDFNRLAAVVYYSVVALGSWITAVINMERSCCVAFPMKVRQIFTRKTIVCLLGGMVTYQLVTGIPRSFGVRLAYVTSPLTNSTKLIYIIHRPRLVIYSYLVSFSIPNIICFFVVVFGTIFLISKFKQSRHLRKSMSGGGTGEEKSKLSDKDLRLVRSMIFISVIYIIGATPGVLIYFGSTAYPALHMDNPYLGSLTLIFFHVSTLFQAVSSSANIFVYVNMGSTFKRTLRQVFCLDADK